MASDNNQRKPRRRTCKKRKKKILWKELLFNYFSGNDRKSGSTYTKDYRGKIPTETTETERQTRINGKPKVQIHEPSKRGGVHLEAKQGHEINCEVPTRKGKKKTFIGNGIKIKNIKSA